MKEKFNDIINQIKNINIELISCTILLLWTISPIVEYIFKDYYRQYYTRYFSTMIYIIGALGFLIYIIYMINYIRKEKTSIKKFIPEILIIILLFISLIATIMSDNPHLSFYGESYRKEGLLVYNMYIGIILLASTIKDSKYIKLIIKSMIANCLIITILPLFKDNFTYYVFDNIFHNFNHYGYYLMINIMLTLFMFLDSNKLIKKILYILIYIFFIYLLIRNNTFGCYLAIMLTLFFIFIYSVIKKYEIKKVIIVISVFIITSFIVSHFDIKYGERVHFEDTRGIILKNLLSLRKDIKGYVDNDEDTIEAAGTYRGLLWKNAGKYIIEHPVIGGGMECLKDYYMNYSLTYNTPYSDRPHNSILQASAFIGIPGAIVYLTLIIYIAISNLIIMKKDTTHIMIFSTAMCYFISSLFGNSMYYTSPYFMILLGLLIGFNRINKQRLTKN